MMLDRVSANQRAIIEHYLNEQPVKVGALARDLGLDVKLSVLPPNISGEIRPSPDTAAGYRININRHEMKERQRFTVAHEIAHYLLHADQIGDGITDNVMYRSGLSNSIETEANRLAAEILMPAPAVNRILRELGGIRTEEVAQQMADRLSVSLPAVKIRLGMM